MAQHAQKLLMLRKTIAAVAGNTAGVRGDLSSLQGSLGAWGAASDSASSRTQPQSGGVQQQSSFFQGWPIALPHSTGLQGLPSLLSKQQQQQQQENSAQSGSPQATWSTIPDVLQPGTWAPTTAQITPPAGASLPVPQHQAPAKDSGPSRALLASLLSQAKVPAHVSRVLEQATARKPGNILPQQQLPSKRPQSSLPRAPGGNTRGNTRSIALNKDITATNSVEQLLALVTAHGHEFDFFNISTAISRMPKLVGDGPGAMRDRTAAQQVPEVDAAPLDGPATAGHTSKAAAPCANAAHLSAPLRDLADRLGTLALRHVHEFDGRGLANTAWAFAKLRYVPDAALPAALCRAAVSRIEQFAAQNVSNLAWALVYLHYQDEQLMQLLKRKACDQVHEMKPQELANMMWALASHEQLDEHTSHVLGQRAARMAHQFKEQELSNVVWAMGRCGHACNPELLEPLLSVVRCRLGAFMPQGVSNMVWALGQMNYHDPVLMAAISRECPHQLHAYDAQALSNLATGLASLASSADPALMAAIAQEVAHRGTRMPPQHMASVLAAATSIGIYNDRLLSSATDLLQSRSSTLDSTTLAALAGVVVHLSAHRNHAVALPASMLPALAHAVTTCADKLNGQALVSLTVHFSKLSGSVASDVLPHLAARLPAALPALTPQQATAMAWALQQAGALTPDLAPSLLRHAMVCVAHEGQEAACALQLSTALTAAANTGYVPDASTQEALLTATLSAVTHMDVPQLCSSCWALAAMGVLDFDSLSAFNHMLESHADSGAMSATDLAGLQLQQVFDAYVMVAAQTSQRLGVPITDVPSHLMPMLPPLIEAAVAQAALLATPPPPATVVNNQQDFEVPQVADLLLGSPQLADLFKDVEAAKALLDTVQSRNQAMSPEAYDTPLDLAAFSYDVSAAAVLSAALQAPPPPPQGSHSAARVQMPRGRHSRGSPNLSSMSGSQIASGFSLGLELLPTSMPKWGQLTGGLWNTGGLGNGTTLTEPLSNVSAASSRTPAILATPPRGVSEYNMTSPDAFTVAPMTMSARASTSEAAASLCSGRSSSGARASMTPNLSGLSVTQPASGLQSARASGSFAMSETNGTDGLARSDSLEDVGGWFLPKELRML